MFREDSAIVDHLIVLRLAECGVAHKESTLTVTLRFA